MNHQEIWETYVASWRTECVEEKKALFAQCLDANCLYHDPLAKTDGWEDLIEYMREFRKQIPGGHFVTKEFLAHGNKSIARWEMRNGDHVVLGEGVSYAEYNNDGRLYEMTGFFQLPQE